MRKWIVLLMLVTGMLAQGPPVPTSVVPYTGIALGNANGVGLVMASANVRVCTAPTSVNPPCITPAILYKLGADGLCSTTPLTNPFRADVSGNYAFCGSTGKYAIEVSADRFGTIRVPATLSAAFDPNIGTIAGTAIPHNLLSETHPDTSPSSPPNRGAIICGNVSGKWHVVEGNTDAFVKVLTETGDGALPGDCQWSPLEPATLLAQQFVPPLTTMSMAFIPPTSVTTHGAANGGGGSVWFTGGAGTLFATATGDTTGGEIMRQASAPLADDLHAWIKWSGFVLPTAIDPLTIQHIYGVYTYERSDAPWGGCNTLGVETPPNCTVGGLGQLHLQCGWETMAQIPFGKFTFSVQSTDFSPGALATQSTIRSLNLTEVTPVATVAAAIPLMTCLAENTDTDVGTYMQDDTKFALVGLVVYYTGTYQEPQTNKLKIVSPLQYTESTNTLDLPRAARMVSGYMSSADFMKAVPRGVPSSNTSACTVGDLAFNATYMYRCVATDTWKRTAWSADIW